MVFTQLKRKISPKFERFKGKFSSSKSDPLIPAARLTATVPVPQSSTPTLTPLTPQSSPSTPPSPGPGPSQGTPRTTLTLWDQAVAKLDAESLRYIDFQQDKIQIVDDLFQATEKMKNIREGAEWSYKNRRGETKSVRESVGTFLANFKKFLPLGDHAVSQAPAIVSFAWGGFKILLQVGLG